MLSCYTQVLWNDPNISWFSSPIFSGKVPEGDEIQLLIGDLFQFPSIFCVMLSCFVHQKIQIKHLNSLSNSVARALCPYHKLGPKRRLFRLGNFWVNVGAGSHQTNFLFKLQNKTTKRNSFDLRKKKVVVWKMRKPVEIGFFSTHRSLMLKNTFKSYGWKCEWIEVFLLQCNVWILFDYLRVDFWNRLIILIKNFTQRLGHIRFG